MIRCWLFGHDPGAIPVLRGSALHVKCLRCHRISPGVPIAIRAKAKPVVVYESRQILKLVKKRA